MRRATYSFAGHRRSRGSAMGTLFADEGVTVDDGFAAFSWGDCMPADDLTDGTRSQPATSRRRQESTSIMSVTPDHRTSSTLAGARSISTPEIKARLAGCAVTTTPTFLRPRC